MTKKEIITRLETDVINYQKRQALSKLSDYYNSYNIKLSDIYKTYSTAKANAYEYCEHLREMLEGTRPRIISYNVNIFTYGFTTYLEHQKYFIYITPSYDIAIKI